DGPGGLDAHRFDHRHLEGAGHRQHDEAQRQLELQSERQRAEEVVHGPCRRRPGVLPNGQPMPSFPPTEGRKMLKGIIGALAIALAAPALAQSNKAKDADDAVKNKVDDAKDKLGTDSGAAKAKRHAKKAARNAKAKARHAKEDANKKAKEATK